MGMVLALMDLFDNMLMHHALRSTRFNAGIVQAGPPWNPCETDNWIFVVHISLVYSQRSLLETNSADFILLLCKSQCFFHLAF